MVRAGHLCLPKAEGMCLGAKSRQNSEPGESVGPGNHHRVHANFVSCNFTIFVFLDRSQHGRPLVPRMTVTSGLRFPLEVNLNVPPSFSSSFRVCYISRGNPKIFQDSALLREGAGGCQAILCPVLVYSHL